MPVPAQQIDQTQRNILAAENTVSELYVEKEQAQKTSIELHQKVEQLIEQQKQADQELRGHRTRQSQVEQDMNQVKLELGQLQVKIEDLTQRVQEEFQIDIARGLPELPAGKYRLGCRKGRDRRPPQQNRAARQRQCRFDQRAG